MTLAAIQPAPTAETIRLRTDPVRSRDAQRFADHLSQAGAQPRVAPSRDQAVRTAAEQLVASTLVLPLLAQMQDDPFRTDLFHGGSAEDMFAAQLNTHLADRIVAKANLPIVEQIYQSALGRSGLALTNPTSSRTDLAPALNTHG